ncbi:MAG: diheme cytochrome c-553 [Bacteroidetes bacterium]|nr:MAG: diheme cytochrome c-553 [Bacteroidota bacterium]
MKKIILSAIGLSVLALACTQQNTSNDASKTVEVNPVADSLKLLESGAYMVNAIGCDDCHTPKKMTEFGPAPDMEVRFSGHPAEQPFKGDYKLTSDYAMFNHSLTAALGPWGISYASNISSDATGIGNWTLEQFTRALREGKSKGLENGRMLLPPMPWPNLKNLSDDDIKAIFYYLKSSKPVRNIVPAPVSPAEMQG